MSLHVDQQGNFGNFVGNLPQAITYHEVLLDKLEQGVVSKSHDRGDRLVVFLERWCWHAA